MVWPFGCVCHAVRAPGVKWTRLALRREASVGAATASMWTTPVNHSLGPVETEDGPRRSRFARSPLANDRQRLARHQVEVDAVDRMHRSTRPAESCTPRRSG